MSDNLNPDDFPACAFCHTPYGSKECYNCPEYDGPIPGVTDEEEDVND